MERELLKERESSHEKNVVKLMSILLVAVLSIWLLSVGMWILALMLLIFTPILAVLADSST